MTMRYLGFLLLLIGFPGALQAPSANQSCSAPSVDGGYFVPEQESYPHGSEISYTCDSGRKVAVEGWWATSTCQNGVWSHEPRCIGSSTTYVLIDRTIKIPGIEVGPVLISVDQCGATPVIPNSVLVEEDRMHLKYQCNAFYTQEGSDTVVCYNDQTWSELPQCREAFCVLDFSLYNVNGLEQSGKQFLKEGETKEFACNLQLYTSRFTCTDQRITYTNCCNPRDHPYGICLKWS